MAVNRVQVSRWYAWPIRSGRASARTFDVRTGVALLEHGREHRDPGFRHRTVAGAIVERGDVHQHVGGDVTRKWDVARKTPRRAALPAGTTRPGPDQE